MRWGKGVLGAGMVAWTTLVAQPSWDRSDPEELHAVVGFLFPPGSTGQRLDAGWSAGFGSTYWVTERAGVQLELGYARMGLSRKLLRELEVVDDGVAEIYSAVLNGVFRLHPRGSGSFYVQAGGGLYQRRLSFHQNLPGLMPQDHPWAGLAPSTVPGDAYATATRGGVDVALGWESAIRGQGRTFFEIRCHRIFMEGEAMTLLPVVVGIRF